MNCEYCGKENIGRSTLGELWCPNCGTVGGVESKPDDKRDALDEQIDNIGIPAIRSAARMMFDRLRIAERNMAELKATNLHLSAEVARLRSMPPCVHCGNLAYWAGHHHGPDFDFSHKYEPPPAVNPVDPGAAAFRPVHWVDGVGLVIDAPPEPTDPPINAAAQGVVSLPGVTWTGKSCPTPDVLAAAMHNKAEPTDPVEAAKARHPAMARERARTMEAVVAIAPPESTTPTPRTDEDDDEPTDPPRKVEPEPVPMLLHCPECRARHIDEGEFATKIHHTHSCQQCGLTWRPAVMPTVGVQFLPGFKNEAGPAAPTRINASDPIAPLDDGVVRLPSAEATSNRPTAKWLQQIRERVASHHPGSGAVHEDDTRRLLAEIDALKAVAIEQWQKGYAAGKAEPTDPPRKVVDIEDPRQNLAYLLELPADLSWEELLGDVVTIREANARLLARVAEAEESRKVDLDARTAVLIEMGQQCVDWAVTDSDGCHLCERHADGVHEEECLIDKWQRTPVGTPPRKDDPVDPGAAWPTACRHGVPIKFSCARCAKHDMGVGGVGFAGSSKSEEPPKVDERPALERLRDLFARSQRSALGGGAEATWETAKMAVIAELAAMPEVEPPKPEPDREAVAELLSVERDGLWGAINEYASSCGGVPHKHIYGNTPRQDAVVRIEKVVREALERVTKEPDREAVAELIAAAELAEKWLDGKTNTPAHIVKDRLRAAIERAKGGT